MSDALLVRGPLAEAALDGRAPAERFVETETLQMARPSAFLHAAAEPRSEARGQLLFGERFEVLERAEGCAFGRAARNGCIGWVELAALGPLSTPTHRVQTLRAFAYAEPDLRSPPAGPLALNALVSAHTGRGRWLHDPAVGWLAEEDLAPIGQGFETDIAAVALRFVGTPHLHGCRDGVGMDAPGLVQQSRYACGLACPGSLAQQRALGRGLKQEEPPARGDLVFWHEQVGLMLDGERLITADPIAGVALKSLPAAFTIRRL